MAPIKVPAYEIDSSVPKPVNSTPSVVAAAPAQIPVVASPPATQTPANPFTASNPFAAPNSFASPQASPFGVSSTVPNAGNIAAFGFKDGGIAALKSGGKFPRKTGPINGPGTATSDSIPAMLSDGEFVFTAKAVRNAGGGSRREGARRMYALMKSLEKQAHA